MKTSIPLQPCTSSRLCGFGYDKDRQVLALQFKAKDGQPGPVYEYQNITPDLAEQFEKAESKGAFFGKVLSDGTKFPYTRMADDEQTEQDAA